LHPNGKVQTRILVQDAATTTLQKKKKESLLKPLPFPVRTQIKNRGTSL
jgi:hypothetical protein